MKPTMIKKTPSGEDVLNKSISTIPQPETPVTVDKSNQIDTWIDMRKQFSQKVVSIMLEGKDYHKLNIRGKEIQVLAKGGAEKVASALGWKAEFVKDSETYEMLGSPAGTLCYICNLKNGEFVGQGRGARTVKQDGGDINKCIKMAQKSAFIDAVLRASGLSDLFTQDLQEGDLQETTQAAYPPTEKQVEFIKGLMEQKQVDEGWVIEQGFDLKNLTGGKEGTASELIEFLKNYIPERATTRVENQMDFTPKFGNIDTTLGIRIDKTDSLASLDMVAKEVIMAFNNKKITKSQLEILKSIGSKRREELSEKEGLVTGANLPL